MAGSVDNQFIDMSRFLQATLGRSQPGSSSSCAGALAVVLLLAVGGCGEVTCPESLSNVEGTCNDVEPITAGEPEPNVESCDGLDNDGDTGVDEDWPELGEACGEGAGVGECVEGEWLCAPDGRGVVCDGAVGPTAEVCDGKDNDCDGSEDNGPDEICDGEDNDCDGSVDEGVLIAKEVPVFERAASVAAVDGGFVVTRHSGDRIFAETYDENGIKTGLDDLIVSSAAHLDFLASDGHGSQVLVSFGTWRIDTMAIEVDDSLAPFIIDKQLLHEDWDKQGLIAVSPPPFYPHVDALSRRVIGLIGSADFGLVTSEPDSIRGFVEAPTVVPGVNFYDGFASERYYIVWPEDGTLRAAFLLDDGRLVKETAIGPGGSPSMGVSPSGLGVVWISGDEIRLSVLDPLSLQCAEGLFCGAVLAEDRPPGGLTDPTGVVYHEASSSWVVVADEEILVVDARGAAATVKQVEQRNDISFPVRIDAVASGKTVAVMRTSVLGESDLTFLGCF